MIPLPPVAHATDRRPTELVNFPIDADTTDANMIVHASCRGLVLLASGQVVTLVRWKGTRHRKRDGRTENHRTARCVKTGGTPFTIPVAEVLAICLEVDAE